MTKPLVGQVIIQTDPSNIIGGKKVYKRGFKKIGFKVVSEKDTTEEGKFYLPLGKKHYKTFEIDFEETNNSEQINTLLTKENNPPKFEQPTKGERNEPAAGTQKKRRRTKRKTKKRKKKKKNKKKKKKK